MLIIKQQFTNTKHIDIRVYYTRKIIKENKIKLKYIISQNNLTDGLQNF